MYRRRREKVKENHILTMGHKIRRKGKNQDDAASHMSYLNEDKKTKNNQGLI